MDVLTTKLYFTFKYEKAMWKYTRRYHKLMYSFTLDIKNALYTVINHVILKSLIAHLPVFSGLNSLSFGDSSAIAVSQLAWVLKVIKCNIVFLLEV